MRVRLQDGTRPYRAKARRYPPEHRKILEKYAQTLKDIGFFVDMPTAQWQAAPLLVPKPGLKAKLRMAVDLRPFNAATIKEPWPMPHLESEILDFAGSSCFGILDFVSAYWQLPLHRVSYTACGMVTPRGVVASTRVLPGLANDTAYFQSSVEPLFSELWENMKAWLNDFNLFCNSEEQLLHLLKRLFEICRQHGLLLSAKKSVLFARELKWCGRIIDAQGYRMDPSNVAGLQNMDLPRNPADLAQLFYCCRWMAISIPNFSVRCSTSNVHYTLPTINNCKYITFNICINLRLIYD